MTISEQLPVARKKVYFFLCEKNYFGNSYARSKIPKRPFYANTRKRRQKWSEKTYFDFKLPAFNKKLTNILFVNGAQTLLVSLRSGTFLGLGLYRPTQLAVLA